MKINFLIKNTMFVVLAAAANLNASSQRLPGTRHFEGSVKKIAYTNGMAGIDITINYSIDFYSRIDAFGDTMPGYCLKPIINKGDYIYYNGKKYSRSEIGAEAYNQIDVRNTEFHADIYDGSDFKTHLDFEMVGNFRNNGQDYCFDKTWGTLFNGSGAHSRTSVYEKNAPSLFYSPNFNLRQIGEFKTETINYGKAIRAIKALEDERSGKNPTDGDADQTSTDSQSNSSNNNSSESSSSNSDSTSSNSSTESNSDSETSTSSKQQQQLNDDQASYQRMQEQTVQNTQAAAAGASAFIYFLYKIAGFIYSDLGYNSGNPFSGDAPSAKLHFGLGFTSAPVYNNTSRQGIEYANGTFSKDGSAQAHQTQTVDFNTRFEAWPLQSRTSGIGFISDLSAGTDLAFQNFKLEGQLGIQTYIGTPRWKALFALYRAQRNQIYRPWIAANETGPGATVKQRYTRVEAGGVYSWWTHYNGLTKAHASLSATFEFPDFAKRTGDQTPPRYLSQWQRGILASIYFENRIKYFVEAYPNYVRLGDREFMVDMRNTKTRGLLLKFGASRCIDDNAKGNYAHKNREYVGNQKTKSTLHMSFNLSQLSRKNIDIPIAINFMAGTGFGYGFNYYLNKNYGLSSGISASIRSFNIEVNNPLTRIERVDSITSRNTAFKYSETAVNLPLAFCYTSSTSGNNKFWIKGGIKLNSVVRAKLYNSFYSRYSVFYGDHPFKKESEVEIIDKRKSYISNFISIGKDYVVNGTNTMTCGLEFERDRTDALNSTIPTRFVTARLVIGLIL